MTEPVATKSACLCGLDTNPVTSPRMDIHCPKHDAPGAGGEPEYPERIWLKHTHQEPGWNFGYYADRPQDDGFVEYTRVSQPAGEPSDEEFNPWYENYEKALVAEVSSPTPADEEVARENLDRCICAEPQPCEASVPMHYQDLLRLVLGRTLAEACRAGTPTTDARERAEVLNKFSGLPHRVHTALHNLWTRAVGSNGYNKAEWRELDDALHEWGYANDAASALSSTPSDETAQRARAAAGDVARFIGAPSTIIGTERLAVIIERYFTATDVEQGKCTWTCEPNPDIEMWETDCGNAFQFEVGGPTENKMQFCCYCGKWLVEKTAEGREEGEEDG